MSAWVVDIGRCLKCYPPDFYDHINPDSRLVRLSEDSAMHFVSESSTKGRQHTGAFFWLEENAVLYLVTLYI